MNNTELLLPAGKFESLRAAIANGADAVYLSGASYGARATAGNFSEDEMKRAVKLCHSKGIKVHVTMNTLLKDDEISDALDYAKFLYDLGVDALIVQDLGLAGAVKQLLPALPLHGSTQMTIHNTITAKWAYDFGFQRVILAREMTIEEMKIIRMTVPDLELEVFCHGAICICYSGQCYMSSLIGGRSGNRGYCAQPCRMKYQLWDPFLGSLSHDPSHLLSPRDMNTLDDVKTLMDIGIVSFKVEGRMRRPEYVASVGKAYRAAIDTVITGKEMYIDKENVKQVFNRDFTSAYLHGNPGVGLMSHQKPNNRGVILGRVKDVSGKIITLDLEQDLRLGDGIEFWVKVGGRVGCTISDLRVNHKKVSMAKRGSLAEICMEGRIHKGDRVFKTYDYELMKSTLESYENMKEDVLLDFHLRAVVGENLFIEAADALGHRVSFTFSYIVEEAQKTPTDEGMVKKQLSRLGGSGYTLNHLTVELGQNCLLPASVLNRCRRELIEQLDKAFFATYEKVTNYAFSLAKKDYLQITKDKEKRNVPKIAVKVRDISQLSAAKDAGADIIYFAPHFGLEKMRDDVWGHLKEINEKYEDLLVFALPQINEDSNREMLYSSIEKALKHGFRQFLLGHPGDIDLKKMYPGMEYCYADFSQNAFNKQTAKELFSMGYEQITASLELTKEDLVSLGNTQGNKEVFVHGAMPMMVSRHCFIGASIGKDKHKVPCGKPCFGQTLYLKDRMNMLFPVVGDRLHHCYIYNCKELALLDELDHLVHFQSWRIEGQFYDIGTLKEIISLYQTGREQVLSKGEYQKDMLLDALQLYTNAGFTKGHLYRGVK